MPGMAKKMDATSPAWFRRLQGIATRNVLSWPDFIRFALYDTEFGYYRRAKARVGTQTGTDFYTASSLGPLFGNLLAEAAATLVGEDFLSTACLVEIGAEPGESIFAECRQRFAEVQSRRLDASLQNLPPRCILVANELLDAQPFTRLRFDAGQWREMGIALGEDDTLEEIQLPEPRPETAPLISELPTNTPDGYRLDLSLEAEELLHSLASQSWKGAIILLDYGRTLQELLRFSPQGTARAYYQHAAQADLLARPGQQDLTCHVCWDRLEAVLHDAGFKSVETMAQESFFVHKATPELQRVLSAAGTDFDPRRQALKGLLTPTHMGRKFQVLSAVR